MDEEYAVSAENVKVKRRGKRKRIPMTSEETRETQRALGIITTGDLAQALGVNAEKVRLLKAAGLKPIGVGQQEFFEMQAVAGILRALGEDANGEA